MAYRITHRCEGCASCGPECPTQAIVPTPSGKFHIVPDRCHDCGACALVCPNKAIDAPVKAGYSS